MKKYLLLVLLASNAFAGENCGSQGSPINKFIPDSLNSGVLCQVVNGALLIPSAKSADFSKACSVHDRCYWTLGSDRGSCDHEFKSQLTEECHRTYNAAINVIERGCCVAFAEAFGGAVRGGGSESYSLGQEDADVVAKLVSSATALPSTSTLKAMSAEYCAANVEAEHCMTDFVAQTMIAQIRSIRQLYSSYLYRDVSIEDLSRFVDAFVANGSNIEIVRKIIFLENSHEIVLKKAQNELNTTPSDAEIGTLSSSLINLGWTYFETQLYVLYARQAVAHIYRTAHGKEITAVWAMYYQNLLIKTKDLESVRAKIINRAR